MNYHFRRSSYLDHQWEFLKSTDKELALVCGFGAGKTFIFLRKTLYHHLTSFNKNGRSNGWIIYPNLTMGKDLFYFPFCQLLDDMGIKHNSNQVNLEIRTKYGRIKVQTLQKPQRFVGEELTYAGIDEFDVESIKNCHIAHQKILGRLRGRENAQLYITTTPEGYKETYRLFVEENKDNKRKMIKGKTTDNPYLPLSYIENLRSSYDNRLLQQYMNGEFVNLQGESAYYEFDDSIHIKQGLALNSNEQLHIGMDFNVNPMSAVVIQRITKGIYAVVDEISLPNSNTETMAQTILSRYGQQWKNKITIHPDMTGKNRSTKAQIGVTDISILQRYGFQIKGSSNPLVKDRLNCVNNAFSKKSLIISSNCKKLIKDLREVIRDDYGNIDKKKNAKDITHISDAMGYAVTNLLPIQNLAWVV